LGPSDQEHLYFKLVLDKEINLQNERNLTIDISYADVEITFNLGERIGVYRRRNIRREIFQNDLGLITSPTVTSKEFEIQINRRGNIEDIEFELANQIALKVYNDESNGDQVPNGGSAIQFELNNEVRKSIPSYSLEKDASSDFRFCSYNVLRDRLFASEARSAYFGIFNTIDADIYNLQEIYDNNAVSTLNRLQNVLGVLDPASDWYSSKVGSDNILVSKYPIIFEKDIFGNGFFVLDKDGQDLIIINIHLPCCDRDDEREREIDNILEYIRESKEGSTNYLIKDNTPIIIAGDSNFVGNSDQVQAFINGNIFNNTTYGGDFQIDWDNNGLADSKPFTTGTNAVYTWYNSRSSYSRGRLDYTLYSDYTMTALNSYVLDTDFLSETELSEYNLDRSFTREASDHYPLVVDFQLNEIVSTSDRKQISYTEAGLYLLAVKQENYAPSVSKVVVR